MTTLQLKQAGRQAGKQATYQKMMPMAML